MGPQPHYIIPLVDVNRSQVSEGAVEAVHIHSELVRGQYLFPIFLSCTDRFASTSGAAVQLPHQQSLSWHATSP